MHVITNSRLNNFVPTPVSTSAAELVRAGFDPSESATVDRIKMLAAALITECGTLRENNPAAGRHAGHHRPPMTVLHCIMFIIWRWLAGSKAGRMAALTGSALLAVALLYRKGRRDAEQAAERDALQGYADTRKTADDALRASDGDTRPVDERLDEHGRLRDEQAHGHGGGTAHPHRLHTPRSQPRRRNL